jgi:VanZ family protein
MAAICRRDTRIPLLSLVAMYTFEMSNTQPHTSRNGRCTWGLPVAVGLVLAILLVHPSVPRFVRGHLPRSIDLRGLGYFAHAACYTFLTTLLLVIIRPRHRSTLMLVVLGIALHGVLTEAAQYWIPARDCDPLDLLANLGGIILAAGVYAGMLSRFSIERRPAIASCTVGTGKDC